MSGRRSIGIDALTQPSADDLGYVRVVVMRPVDAVPRDLIVEISVGVGVCAGAARLRSPAAMASAAYPANTFAFMG